MHIAVVGGKLQGLEALYLAQKVNIKTTLIDRNDHAPAVNLCDSFVKHHFSPETPFPQLESDIDLILPALENVAVLQLLQAWSKREQIPLAFDLEAFLFTMSKERSDRLFSRLNLPAPLPWPDCGLPVIIKPEGESGSRGVKIIRDLSHLDSHQKGRSGSPGIVQQYLPGPSYSLEILGQPGRYQVYQVTELHMDSAFDCCGVTAPAPLSSHLVEQFTSTAETLAEAIALKGLMDVEVILHEGSLKLLEIDARLPSQTPITVFHSTGLNMVEQLCNLFTGKPLVTCKEQFQSARVEHLLVDGATLEILGEHIMGEDGRLSHHHSFFGATEAITSYEPGKERWVATLIFTGDSHKELTEKRGRCYRLIKEHLEKKC